MQHTHPLGTVHRLWWSDFETEQTSKKTPSWVSPWGRQLRMTESNPTQHSVFCLAGSQTPRGLWDFPSCFLISPDLSRSILFNFHAENRSVLSERENHPHSCCGLPFHFFKHQEFEAYQTTEVKDLWRHTEISSSNSQWSFTKEMWSWEHRHLFREYLSR